MLVKTGFKKDDSKGSLLAYEFLDIAEFVPKRIYFLSNVPPKQVRGRHAHKKLQQQFVAIKGSFKVVLDDGIKREKFTLETPSVALMVRPKMWRELYDFSPDAICLVIASENQGKLPV